MGRVCLIGISQLGRSAWALISLTKCGAKENGNGGGWKAIGRQI